MRSAEYYGFDRFRQGYYISKVNYLLQKIQNKQINNLIDDKKFNKLNEDGICRALVSRWQKAVYEFTHSRNTVFYREFMLNVGWIASIKTSDIDTLLYFINQPNIPEKIKSVNYKKDLVEWVNDIFKELKLSRDLRHHIKKYLHSEYIRKNLVKYLGNENINFNISTIHSGSNNIKDSLTKLLNKNSQITSELIVKFSRFLVKNILADIVEYASELQDIFVYKSDAVNVEGQHYVNEFNSDWIASYPMVADADTQNKILGTVLKPETMVKFYSANHVMGAYLDYIYEIKFIKNFNPKKISTNAKNSNLKNSTYILTQNNGKWELYYAYQKNENKLDFKIIDLASVDGLTKELQDRSVDDFPVSNLYHSKIFRKIFNLYHAEKNDIASDDGAWLLKYDSNDDKGPRRPDIINIKKDATFEVLREYIFDQFHDLVAADFESLSVFIPDAYLHHELNPRLSFEINNLFKNINSLIIEIRKTKNFQDNPIIDEMNQLIKRYFQFTGSGFDAIEDIHTKIQSFLQNYADDLFSNHLSELIRYTSIIAEISSKIENNVKGSKKEVDVSLPDAFTGLKNAVHQHQDEQSANFISEVDQYLDFQQKGSKPLTEILRVLVDLCSELSADWAQLHLDRFRYYQDIELLSSTHEKVKEIYRLFHLINDDGINYKTSNGRTALHAAVDLGDFDLAYELTVATKTEWVQDIISNDEKVENRFRINLDAKDNNDVTALYLAYVRKSYLISQFLIRAGADPTVPAKNKNHKKDPKLPEFTKSPIEMIIDDYTQKPKTPNICMLEIVRIHPDRINDKLGTIIDSAFLRHDVEVLEAIISTIENPSLIVDICISQYTELKTWNFQYINDSIKPLAKTNGNINQFGDLNFNLLQLAVFNNNLEAFTDLSDQFTTEEIASFKFFDEPLTHRLITLSPLDKNVSPADTMQSLVEQHQIDFTANNQRDDDGNTILHKLIQSYGNDIERITAMMKIPNIAALSDVINNDGMKPWEIAETSDEVKAIFMPPYPVEQLYQSNNENDSVLELLISQRQKDNFYRNESKDIQLYQEAINPEISEDLTNKVS